MSVSSFDFLININVHSASSCAECPQGHGSAWCNGVCTWDNNLNGCVANTCGPLFSGRRCSDVGNNKYCNANTGECGSSDLHQFAQLGNEFDSPDIVDAGRCGPLFGGRVCNCNRFEVYCNTVNGWCGSGDAHKNAQGGEEYDCPYFVSFPTSFSFATTTCSFDSTKIFLCH